METKNLYLSEKADYIRALTELFETVRGTNGPQWRLEKHLDSVLTSFETEINASVSENKNMEAKENE